MITKLKIANFKSHLNTELNMGALTVLTGINSSGKSSVLQSLLLLRQSFKNSRLGAGLDLNRPLCDIGNGYDALSRFANNEIKIDNLIVQGQYIKIAYQQNHISFYSHLSPSSH
jgi:predicted ATPase